MKKISLFFLALVFSTAVFATDAHDHDEEKEAIEIELSGTAIQNYGITTMTVKGEDITLPKSAVVLSKDEFFIYRQEGKHFQEIEIHPIQITSDTISFEYHTDEPESEFVITGVPYLRVVFLSNKNPIEGHAH